MNFSEMCPSLVRARPPTSGDVCFGPMTAGSSSMISSPALASSVRKSPLPLPSTDLNSYLRAATTRPLGSDGSTIFRRKVSYPSVALKGRRVSTSHFKEFFFCLKEVQINNFLA